MMALTLRLFWVPHGIFSKPVDMRTGGHAAKLNEAKAQFETAWRQWLVGEAAGNAIAPCVPSAAAAGWPGVGLEPTASRRSADIF